MKKILTEKEVANLLVCYEIRLGRLKVGTHRYRRTKLRGAILALQQVLGHKKAESYKDLFTNLKEEVTVHQCGTGSLLLSQS